MAAKRQRRSSRPEKASGAGGQRKVRPSQTAVVAAFARIFREALTCKTQEELYRVCLAAAEEVTQSKLGFLGELNPQTGKLDDVVLSEPAWEACRIEDPSGQGKMVPVGFAVHGVYGRVLLDGKGFFTNDPPSHPDAIGTPPGHPPLSAFLGVPLVHAGATIGMVGLGNRPGGYGPEQLEAVEALAPAIVQAILGKRADEALQRAHDELEQKVKERTAELAVFQGGAEASGRGYAIADLKGRITYANPALCRLLGEENPEDVIGKHISTYYPEGHRQKLENERIGAVLREGIWEGERAVLSRNGTRIAILEHSFLIRDDRGMPSRLATVISDLTEQKKAEAALRASEERYHLAVEGAGVGIWDWDIRNGKVFYSPRWKRLFGYEEHEIGDGFDDWARLLHPDEREWIIKYQEDFLRGTLPNVTAEYRLRHKDGSYRWIEAHAIVVRDEAGKACRLVGSHGDITARKRAEEALKTLNETLEQRVTERTEAIQMLHNIASMANEAQNAGHAIEHCLQRLAAYYGWDFGHALVPAADNPDELVPRHVRYPEGPDRFRRFREVTLGMRFRRGEDLPGRALASSQPEWTTDLGRDLAECRAVAAEELGLGTAIAFPVLVGEKVAGVLEFFSDRVIEPDPRSTDTMVGVGLQLSRVLERASFEEHLLTIAEEIQQRIAQDLHDDVGQELTGLALKTETLAEMLAAANGPARKLAADVAAGLDRTRTKVRKLSRGLLPVELEEGLLAGALGQLAATATAGSPIACTFGCFHPDPVFDGRVAMHLYRIAQQAVSNAVRHSGARNIRITLAQEHGGTALSIEDDGTGLSSEALQAEGMGLRIMRYRADLIGGELEVGAALRGGTRVVCRLVPQERELPA